MLVALVLTLLSQADAPVAPQPAPAAAESEIERARVMINDLYEEQALEVLSGVLADPQLAASLRARALIYFGVAHLNLGHEEPGRRAFREALAQDIGATPPEWVSRRVRAVFEGELALAMRPQPVVTPTPTPAPVAVTAPLTVPVARERQAWIPVAFAGGMVASATFSVLGFSRFSAQYAQAQHSRAALDAQRLDASSRVWLAVGEIATGAALACAAGILWWWLSPVAR